MKLIVCLAFAAMASAHPLQITGVVVHADNSGTTVTVTAHAPLLKGVDPDVAIRRRLRLRLDGEEFRPSGIHVERDPSNDTVVWTAQDERHAGAIAMDSPVFPEQAGDTTVLLVYRDERLVDRAVLSPAHPSATVGEGRFAMARRFIRMGILHILSGPDHILFLLGLILAGGTVRQLFGVVTAFTLAHSVTLTLTALGVASLPSTLVEPLIAFSIVAVGVENLLSRKSDFALRAGLAFGFGFFHGFGFAGALADAGLPQRGTILSLASFNIGVEIGQAFILALVLPLLAAIRHTSERSLGMVTRFASLAITLAGAAWFVERIS